MGDTGAYDDALKAFQLGLTACDRKQHSAVISELSVGSAFALARLGERSSALRTLSQAYEFHHSDPFEDADLDYTTYHIHYALGNIDKAHSYALLAVQKWKDSSARDSIKADIALATLAVQTGSGDGPSLAYAAIKNVSNLASVRAKQVKLPPLVKSLSLRGNTELARLGSQVINSP